jgi:sRNA-binding protein
MKAKLPAPGEGAGSGGSAKRTPQPNPTSPRTQAIDALEARIRATWPAAFDPASRRPLAIGTGDAIAERLELPSTSRKPLHKLMVRWCRHDRYLQALAEPGAWRIDLDGQPVELVSADHQRAAVERLEQRRRRRSGQRPPGANA